ncbi:heterokaryon incompatibility protein-domain-containing protein [Paraphoma chrysanthemicola]|nr:heterokaryon incompatibility protein-domain-containing protein [Paraphoma chrysanthemicola]
MRLLDVRTLKLHTFYGDAVPQYTILSHTWLQDVDEVTFQQIQTPQSCEDMKGFRKIKLLCEQTQKDGFGYAWIDTCCIDKSNHSELSEAINSMFAWYQHSSLCYAYLADIDEKTDDFLDSRWWSRAWTLQELLAPEKVMFFDRNWVSLGLKSDFILARRISENIGIDEDVLRRPQHIFTMSIAQRMSWAASREATRSEDSAYSLLGIFNINMPMLYGEGTNAFVRLQKEILKTTRDQSLFAWSVTSRDAQDLVGEWFKDDIDHSDTASLNSSDMERPSYHGMFASHPSAFRASGIISFEHDFASYAPITEINGALVMEMPLVRLEVSPDVECLIGLLACQNTQRPDWAVGTLLLGNHDKERYLRAYELSAGYMTFCVRCPLAAKAEVKSVRIEELQSRDERFSYRNPSGPARTLCASLDSDSETLRLFSVPYLGAVNPVVIDPMDLTCYLGRQYNLRMRLGIVVVPKKSGSELLRELDLFLFNPSVGPMVDLVDLVSFHQPDDSSDMIGNATSSATDLTRDAKIEVTVSSRRIFNHIITDLKITVRRYESSG